jgi:hypothetical protein
MDEIITNKSEWCLVVQRTSQTRVEVWVGTLFPTLAMPHHARVRLNDENGVVETKRIIKKDWKRPFSKLKQRFYCVCTFTNLKPGSYYTLEFDRRIEEIKGVIPQSWQHLRSGQFDTLPLRIPTKGNKPFTVGLGSCYYHHRDSGQAAASYRALYERGGDQNKPDVTFLTGDQVYLDIGFDSLSLIPDEIRQRIANDYAKHWQALGSILSRGATWMLPDDHEFWNDFPFYDSLIPTLLALKLPWVRRAWQKAANNGVQNIQRSRKLEFLNFDKDLSVCLADLRSYRKKSTFLPKAIFEELTDWAKNLEAPAVLVVPQPLIVNENESERNLLSFKKQYTALLEALAHSGHDIVLLTGDVHFGRISTVDLGNNGARLIEIIASPLSNLSGLNGLATAKPNSDPEKFPDPKAVQIDAWDPAIVNHSKSFQVSTKKGRLGSVYPKDRTTEHFMTVGFTRLTSGGIELCAKAWRVRERSGGKHLPAKDFIKPFKVVLK